MTLLQSIRQAFRQWVKRWIVADVEPDPLPLACEARAVAFARFQAAKDRHDKRGEGEAFRPFRDATCDQLRAEVGR